MALDPVWAPASVYDSFRQEERTWDTQRKPGRYLTSSWIQSSMEVIKSLLVAILRFRQFPCSFLGSHRKILRSTFNGVPSFTCTWNTPINLWVRKFKNWSCLQQLVWTTLITTAFFCEWLANSLFFFQMHVINSLMRGNQVKILGLTKKCHYVPST